MKIILALLLCLQMSLGMATSLQMEKACENYVVFREASGEGILTQKAVLDVLHNRARILGKSVCAVAHQPYQFPYMIEGLKPVPNKFLTRMEILRNMSSVVPSETFFFNDVKLSFGKFHARIGGLYFNTRGVKYAVNF